MTEDSTLSTETQERLQAPDQIAVLAQKYGWLRYSIIDEDLSRLPVLRGWSLATSYVTHIWYRATDSYEYGHYLETTDHERAVTAFENRLKEQKQ